MACPQADPEEGGQTLPDPTNGRQPMHFNAPKR